MGNTLTHITFRNICVKNFHHLAGCRAKLLWLEHYYLDIIKTAPPRNLHVGPWRSDTPEENILAFRNGPIIG